MGYIIIFSAPYKPSTNGEAEKAVQTFKRYLKKTSNENIKLKLCQFLLQYRITPHATTGLPPAELFMKRHIKTRLDLLRPDKVAELNKRIETERVEDRKKLRVLRCGQLVQALNFSEGSPKWEKGVIVGQTGPVS